MFGSPKSWIQKVHTNTQQMFLNSLNRIETYLERKKREKTIRNFKKKLILNIKFPLHPSSTWFLVYSQIPNSTLSVTAIQTHAKSNKL